jgi:hypothetical protein
LEVCGKQVRINGTLVRMGFVNGEGYQSLDEPERAIEALRKTRKRIDLFAFVQRISETKPIYSYPVEPYNMAVLPISTFDDWMSNTINFKVRNKVRKAAKSGAVIQEVPLDENLIQGISTIYDESPIRQGKPFRHYRKDLETLRRMKATFADCSIYIGAYFEGNLIGFIKLVFDEHREQAGLMHIFSMIKHRDKASNNALIAQAVKWCAERGIPNLWYSNMSYGTKQSGSLAEFKRHNGFLKVEAPRSFVPLTTAGRIALKLGLHHSLADWVPERIAARYRKVRSIWYAKRFPGLQDA